MSNDRHPLSIAEVLELSLDAEGGAWVNDGFTAVIRSVGPKPNRANKKIWAVELGDTTGSASLPMSMFMAPKFAAGQRVDFLGKGIRFKDSPQYGKEMKISDKTEIHVLGGAVHGSGQPVPREGKPTDDSRGDGAASSPPPGSNRAEFHLQMKKMGILYCHADAYARKADALCGSNWSPEERQACRSSLFIEACRRNLLDIVPPLGEAQAAATAPAPRPAPAAPPPGRSGDARPAFAPGDGVDEDVPF